MRTHQSDWSEIFFYVKNSWLFGTEEMSGGWLRRHAQLSQIPHFACWAQALIAEKLMMSKLWYTKGSVRKQQKLISG